MPMIIYTNVPPMSLLTNESFDLKQIEAIYSKPRKTIAIKAITGKMYYTRSANIALIQSVTDEEMDKAKAKINERLAMEKIAAERSGQGSGILEPAAKIPGGRR